MKRLLSVLITSLLIVGTMAAAVSAASFDDLTSYQKQKFWQMWEKDCYQLLVDQKYGDYFTCSTGTMENASKLVEKTAAWCKDSDGGMDYFNKGTVTTDVYPNGIEDYFYTFSNGKSYLIEGACSTDNRYMYYQKRCGEIGANYTNGDGICESVLNVEVASDTTARSHFVTAGSEDNVYGRYYFNLDSNVSESIGLKSLSFKRVDGEQTDNFSGFEDNSGYDGDFGKVKLYLGTTLGGKGSTKLLQATYIVQNHKIFFNLDAGGVIAKIDANSYLEIRADVNPLVPQSPAKYASVDALVLENIVGVGNSSGSNVKFSYKKAPVYGRMVRKSVPSVFNGSYTLSNKISNGKQPIYRFSANASSNGGIGIRSIPFRISSNLSIGKDVLIKSAYVVDDETNKVIEIADFLSNGKDDCKVSDPAPYSGGTAVKVYCAFAKDLFIDKESFSKSFTLYADLVDASPNSGLVINTNIAPSPLTWEKNGVVPKLVGYLWKHNAKALYTVASGNPPVSNPVVTPTSILYTDFVWTDYYKKGVNDWTYFDAFWTSLNAGHTMTD